MVSKAPKLRGQAFVTFKEISDASAAVKRLQGFPFYDKPLRIAFARRESTVITAAKKYQAPKDERAQAKGTGKRKICIVNIIGNICRSKCKTGEKENGCS